MSSRKPHILGLCGSLRSGSFNGHMLAVAERLAPTDVVWSRLDLLSLIPPYDADLDGEIVPEPVAQLRSAISACDGIFIATPEYNHSIPGVLKNAIDWASRPAGRGSISGKCIAVAVATTGRNSGFRGLADTKRILSDPPLANYVVSPEVVVTEAASKFTVDGSTATLNDPVARGLISVQLQSVVEAVRLGVADLGVDAARRAMSVAWAPASAEAGEKP